MIIIIFHILSLWILSTILGLLIVTRKKKASLSRCSFNDWKVAILAGPFLLFFVIIGAVVWENRRF